MAELIWGWTQFILNVVLIISSFKIVHDLGVYLKTSNLRCKRLYQKICWEGLKLNNRISELDCFVPLHERRRFTKLVIELLALDPKVENHLHQMAYHTHIKNLSLLERYLSLLIVGLRNNI